MIQMHICKLSEYLQAYVDAILKILRDSDTEWVYNI